MESKLVNKRADGDSKPRRTPTVLTDRFVKTAPVGRHWDAHKDAPQGFLLRVHGGGTRSFCLQYNGREIKIGDFPTWSTEAARERARELRREIDQGIDPLERKRERREAPTMQDLADRYLAEHLPTLNRNSTAKRRLYAQTDARKVVADIIKRLGPRTPVGSVHWGDVQALHKFWTGARGASRANRLASTVSRMFTLSLVPMAGEDKPWRTPYLGNPAARIPRNYEEPRGKLYSPAELAAISDALTTYPRPRAADAIRLVMLTGARPHEAVRARWVEFDQEPGKWVKPSAHSKVKRTHVVPLSAPAQELIDRLRQGRVGEYLFPGPGGEPMVTLQHIWRHVRQHAKIEGRIYDLRHTVASVAASSGLSLPIIGRLLGHTKSSTTERYARHLSTDPLQEAVDRIAAQLMPSKPPAPVVKLPRKR
jgi:integrase